MSGKAHSERPTNSLLSCERCAQLEELLRQAEDNLAELGLQRAGLELNLRRAGSAELALRRELEQHREDDPASQEVRRLLDYWKLKLNHPKAKTPLSGGRAKLVLKAMRMGYKPDQIRQAIDGLAKLPYVRAGGRKPDGAERERFDDLGHCLKDEATIERFIRYATTPAPGRSAVPLAPAVERILERLDAARQTGPGQWEARCPAHDDRHSSLSVAQGEKGAVATCHAGCELHDIAEAVGVPLAEWFDREPPQIAPKPPAALPSEAMIDGWRRALQHRPRLLARLEEVRGWLPQTLSALAVGWDGERIIFPVRNADGDLQTIARYLPGGNPKMLGLHGRERGLFPQPEGYPADDVLWVVEGEPDAVTGFQQRVAAVAVPGVNGWRRGMAERFAGREVVVCLDCDKPGRDAARKIADDLRGVASDVRILDLDEDRDDGYDLTDAVAEGATTEILWALENTAPTAWKVAA